MDSLPNVETTNTAHRPSRGRFPILVWVVPLVAVIIAVPAYYVLVMIPERQQLLRKHELMSAALQYHEFYDVNSRPPANLDEFMNYEPEGLFAMNPPRDLTGFADKVRSGQIVVLWNSRVLESGEENDQHLLAYESLAPEAGGLVLMGGGSVKLVTAEDFATLPKLPTGDPD